MREKERERERERKHERERVRESEHRGNTPPYPDPTDPHHIYPPL